jgi:hypothetical protein
MAVAIYVTPEELAEAMDQEPSELVQLLSNLASIHEDDPIERIDFLNMLASEAHSHDCVRLLTEFFNGALWALTASNKGVA